MMRSIPPSIGCSCSSVTMQAISMRASLVRSSPVISQSIHTIGALTMDKEPTRTEADLPGKARSSGL